MNNKIATITVLELIAELGKLPLEAPVILTTDPNGTSFYGINKLELDATGNVIVWCSSAATDEPIEQ